MMGTKEMAGISKDLDYIEKDYRVVVEGHMPKEIRSAYLDVMRKYIPDIFGSKEELPVIRTVLQERLDSKQVKTLEAELMKLDEKYQMIYNAPPLRKDVADSMYR